ncbi:unnamed protein product [Owenia fusiformis]|uniref:Uncharacterized protein n=1 Tax=Owenia fusiformis TaxID=6347 RepID=A0A8J1UQ21_OWEFU|nr:unnamed protein product [Owenia fusiformis]
MMKNNYNTKMELLNLNRSQIRMLTIWICFMVCISPTSGQTNGTDTDTRDVTSINKGLSPFYTMTNGFLSTIQRNTLTSMIGGLDLSKGPQVILDDIAGNFNRWLNYFGAYIACAVVGLLFALIFPLAGCITCCCRSCGKCGGKGDPQEGKYAKVGRILMLSFLAAFCILILFGVVGGFLSNRALRDQTDNVNNRGVFSTLAESMDSIQTYKDTAIQDMDTEVMTGFSRTRNVVFDALDGIGVTSVTILKEISNAGPLFDDTTKLATQLETVQGSLIGIRDGVQTLGANITTLTSQLNDVKTDVTNKLNSCNDPRCADALAEAEKLTVNINVANIPVAELTLAIEALNEVIGQDITGKVEQIRQGFDQLTDVINNNTAPIISEAKLRTDEIQDQLSSFINQTRNALDTQAFFQDATKYINGTLIPPVREYGNYWYIGCIVVCSIIVLIITCYLLAVLIGFCGQAPYEDLTDCNRNNGSCLFKSGIVFTFLFGWLFMLITMALFLGGGLAHNEVCNRVVDLKNSEIIQITDPFVMRELQKAININTTITNIIRQCSNNMALYTAINFDSYANITEYLDIDRYNITENFAALTNITVDLSGVQVITPELRNILSNVSQIDLMLINTTIIKNELNQDVTAINLNTYAATLRTLSSSGLPGVDLNSTADELTNLAATFIPSMTTLKNNILSHVKVLEDNRDLSAASNSLVAEMEKSQESIQTNGTAAIRSIGANLTLTIRDNLQSFMTNLDYVVRNNIGRCGVVYSALDNSVIAACKNVLYPFNSFWFAMGWCIFFMMPAMVLAWMLVDQFKKTQPYSEVTPFEGEGRPLNSQGGMQKFKDKFKKKGKQPESNGAAAAATMAYDESQAQPMQETTHGGQRVEIKRLDLISIEINLIIMEGRMDIRTKPIGTITEMQNILKQQLKPTNFLQKTQ